MNQQHYKIRGMDCAEEVATLKRALGSIVGGDDRLSFDLINGKLGVSASANADSAEILRAVAQTGMRAIPWDDFVREQAEGVRAPFWRRESRTILCAVSGVCLLSGFVLHWFLRGFGEALAGPHEGAAYPSAVVLLYLIALVAGVWFVLPKAWYAARAVRPDMNLLMTVAIAGALGLGEYFEAGSVAFLFALALLLETWSVGRARRAIGALMDLSPPTARMRCPSDGDIEEKPVAEIPLNVSVLVRPGERIPLDGTVTTGETTVNEAPITGESVPAEKSPGDSVYAGSINEGGAFEFTVTRAAQDTTLARIVRMVEEAQSRRAPSEQWVEKFARIYTPCMFALALGVFLVPQLWGADWIDYWFYQALVILVIACPCALVISTPVSIVAGLATAARHGVLIKGGAFLEAPARLRAIAFDKTGTVTTGRPEVQRVVPLNGHDERELLERAAAMEAHSTHPLAQAIVRYAAAQGVAPEPVEAYRELSGRGAEATFRGRPFWIGSHRLVHDRHAEENWSAASDESPVIMNSDCTSSVIARSGVGDEAISSADRPSQSEISNLKSQISSSIHPAHPVNPVQKRATLPPVSIASCNHHDTIEAIEAGGSSVVAIGNDRHLCGVLAVADAVRPDASRVLAELREAGVEHLVMLTGDNRGTAAAVARSLMWNGQPAHAGDADDRTGKMPVPPDAPVPAFDDVYAELLPEEKVGVVRDLATKYGRVAMIGDGINDAPALAASTVGIAMGAAGSDVAIETADIALMSDDLTRVPWLIRHSRRTLRVIQQNIAFALGLKLVFIALAFAGLATLWMAIAADMGASLLVIANALRLLRD